MKILHVIASPNGSSSESYRLSQTVIRHLMDLHCGCDFVLSLIHI